jgi:hypothetical protein
MDGQYHAAQHTRSALAFSKSGYLRLTSGAQLQPNPVATVPVVSSTGEAHQPSSSARWIAYSLVANCGRNETASCPAMLSACPTMSNKIRKLESLGSRNSKEEPSRSR